MRLRWIVSFFAVVFVSLIATLIWAVEEPAKKSGPFRYDARGRRDPFLPLIRDGQLVDIRGDGSSESGPTSTPVLYGILWDPGGASIALINGVEAKVGDRIDDYKVAEIRRDAVVLTNGGEPVVLQIAFETPPTKLSPGTTTGGEGR